MSGPLGSAETPSRLGARCRAARATPAVWLVLCCLVVDTAWAGVPGTPGPFVGVLIPGGSSHHDFDNNPLGGPCFAVNETYHVKLDYTPPSDTLTLAVQHVGGDEEVAGADGRAEMIFDAAICTSFGIEVRGTNVETAAAYAVHAYCEDHLPVQIEIQARCF